MKCQLTESRGRLVSFHLPLSETDRQTDRQWEVKGDRQRRGGIKWNTRGHLKIKLDREMSNMVCLNSWWRSLSDSFCGLEDNRPTESFWQNMTLTLILPLRLSVSMWLSLRDKLALLYVHTAPSLICSSNIVLSPDSAHWNLYHKGDIKLHSIISPFYHFKVKLLLSGG